MGAAGEVRILDQRTAAERDRAFLPGMGRTWLLPLYDVSSRLSGDRTLHTRAVALAGVAPGQAVLDVGCGTGNLALTVLAATPDARVTGLDPDGAALRRAARKARRRGVSLTLVQGYADRLPGEDASLDHVLSSLAVHHLEDGRAGFAREAFRVLRPGGTITIVDFGGPEPATSAGDAAHGHGKAHGLRHLTGLVGARVAGVTGVPHSLGDTLPGLLAEAGFDDAREVDHVDHRQGRISIVQATRT